MRFHTIASLLIYTVLAGCATIAPRDVAMADAPANASAEAPGSAALAQPQMRVVFVPACPISQAKSEGALGALALAIGVEVGGKLIGSVIDSLADSLSKSDEVSFTDSTRRRGFAALTKGELGWNKAEGCMVVVIAREFDRKMDDQQLAGFDPFPGRTTNPTVAKRVVTATGLSSPALFYFEAVTEYDGGKEQSKSAFAFNPVEFYYPGFISPSGMKYSSRRDVAFKVELSTPGADGAFGDIDLLWKGVKSGEIARDSVIRRKLPWHPLPEGLDKLGTGDKSDAAVPVYPVNVKVLFTETKNPHTFFKFIGQSLRSNKDDAVAATEQSINYAFSQQARATARLAAMTDIDKKYADYVAAYDATVEAQAKHAAAGSDRTRRELLAKAQNAGRVLDSAELNVRLAYSHAGINGFEPLPALPKL